MAGIQLELDPTSESASNTPLVLVDDANGKSLMAVDWPAPEPQGTFTSSADTEGERLVNLRFNNRDISLTLRYRASTPANLATAIKAVEQKVGKVNREGATLKAIFPSGDVIVFDLLTADIGVPIDKSFVNNVRSEFTLRFKALPYGRGAEQTLTAHTEATLPALVFTETGIKGDVPANARLVVTDAQGQAQRFCVWGVQSRYYSNSADAALFYEAESRAPLSSAATAVGPSGASGSGSNVIQHASLTTSYQGVLSTQASGAGNHLAHIGDFEVWARVYTPAANAGVVSCRLQWAVGDFASATSNTAVTLSSATYGDKWSLQSLGVVRITQATAGTQRWEGRVLAKSTGTGDTINVDHIMLVPVAEGSGRAAAKVAAVDPPTYTLRDDFDQTSGSLAGKTLPVGGTWSGTGGSSDFTLDTTNHRITKTASSEAVNNGRQAVASTSITGGVIVQVDRVYGITTSFDQKGGVLARYVDSSNFLQAYITDNANNDAPPLLIIRKNIAGTYTTLRAIDFNVTNYRYLAGQTVRLRLLVSAGGVYALYATYGVGDSMGSPWAVGYDPVLATGGTLANGKCGVYDETNSGGGAHFFDAFWAAGAIADAAIFPSQPLEISSSRVTRRDSTGAVWGAPASYEGDLLTLPPAAMESRSLRVIVKATRLGPDEGMIDPAIDDIAAQLFYTPRYIQVPYS